MYKAEVKFVVTNGDFFARKGVVLGKQDGDAGRFIVDGAIVPLTGVIHASDA